MHARYRADLPDRNMLRVGSLECGHGCSNRTPSNDTARGYRGRALYRLLAEVVRVADALIPDWLVKGCVFALLGSVALGTFYYPVVPWLESPGGNLLWDLLLQAAGIFITVVVIQRWVEKREENRWLPLKHRTYILLLMITDSLVLDLHPPKTDERQALYYYFGERAVVSSVTNEFGNKLMGLADDSFISRAKEIIARYPQPREIYQNYKEFRETIGWGSVILGREPELSNLVTNLDMALTTAVESLTSTLETADQDKEDLLRRAEPIILAGYFKRVAQEAYRLNEWLKSKADATSVQTKRKI